MVIFKMKGVGKLNETKKETIGIRPSEYSQWHRTLGPEYMSVDIDFVEYRHNKGIVGFFGVTGRCKDERHMINSKKYIWNRTKIERQILFALQYKTGIQSYFVIHTENMDRFHVHKIEDIEKDDSIYFNFNLEQYSNFIKNL